MIKRLLSWIKRLFCKCHNCKYSYCELDGIPDWRCKYSDNRKMVEPNGYCEYWRAE